MWLPFLLSTLLSFQAQAQESTAAQEAAKEAATAEATLDLEWEKIEDATSYEVKLTPNSGTTPIKFQTSNTKLTEKLPLGVYKLQIRSKDKSTGYFGPWSPPTEVEVETKTVQLISPAEGSEIAQPKEKRAQVEFQWSPIEKAKEYTLRIWFDDERNAREFKSKTNKKLLTLPAGKAYAWQVTFLTDKSVGYLAAPQIGNFKVLGKQLIKPVIAEATKQKAKWKPSPGAKSYKVKLLIKALDEDEWSVFKDFPKQDVTALSFEKLKPANYKLEVVAQAPNHMSSEPATAEFTVKPSHEELARAMKRAVQ